MHRVAKLVIMQGTALEKYDDCVCHVCNLELKNTENIRVTLCLCRPERPGPYLFDTLPWVPALENCRSRAQGSSRATASNMVIKTDSSMVSRVSTDSSTTSSMDSRASMARVQTR